MTRFLITGLMLLPGWCFALVEPPMLALDVSTGKLPPLEKRLPQPPLVVRVDQAG